MLKLNVSDLEDLIDEHGKAIYSFCHKLALTQSDTDDLYQQTFLKALEVLGQIDREQNPKSFLISIAISTWKNMKRKSARRHRIAPTTSMEDLQYEEIACTLNIEDDFLTKTLSQEVNLIVSQLPDKFKIPTLLFYTSEFPTWQIAKILKLPQGTIKSRLYKARLLIKKELEAKGYG